MNKLNFNQNIDTPYVDRVALEKIKGVERGLKFGRNAEIGVSEVVIWDNNSNYTFLENAEFLNIVSTDLNDTALGTGARTLLVAGLDADYIEQSEIISLDGLTPIQTTKKYLRTNRVIVLTSGTASPIGDSNLGDITLTSNTTATLQAKVLIGNGQTLMLVYTVPANKRMLVSGLSFSVSEGKACLFKVRVRNGTATTSAFSVKFTLDLFQTAVNLPLTNPFLIEEKTDMVITGTSKSTGVAGSGAFSFRLLDLNGVN